MPLVVLVLLPFAGCVLAVLLPTRSRTVLASVAGVVAVVAAVWIISLYPRVRGGGVIEETLAWVPSLGLDITLRIDGFAWMFGVLVTVIGALVALYARYYMSPADPVVRFYALFLAFMGAMLGIVFAGNLLLLVVFWELTSVVSFLLVGYWHHRVDAQRGARMALIVTGAGGLALLGGVIVLGNIVGSYELDAVLAAGDRIRAHPYYALALGLILGGALTKSAQVPFQFWLPRAMAAPTPASSYLHSATMVKAGVFLLARLWQVLSGTELWFWLVGGAGATTLLVGAYLAMFQYDLKRILAYSTISHLGLITLLFGLNSPLAAVAGVFHIINHATFKASLFMAAGIVDHETGTRDIRRLHGLRRVMPRTAALALVATAAMAGVPLLNGFLSKEMFFGETLDLQANPWVDFGLPILATVASGFAVVYSLRVGYDIFFGAPPIALPREAEEAPRWMRTPITLLVMCCLVVGIAPGLAIGPTLATAARPVVGGPLPAYSLAVWHGFTTAFVMSLVAIAGGVAGYFWLRRRQARDRLQAAPVIARIDASRLFEGALVMLAWSARRTLHVLAPRRLQPQMFAIVTIATLLALLAARSVPLAWGERARQSASPAFVILWFIGAVCAVGAAVMATMRRLVSITLMGGAGLVTCVTFAWFSAPDLALTQIVVEVVTTTLFLLGLRWLPMDEDVRPIRVRNRVRAARDLVLAVSAGAGLAVLSYALLTRPAPHSISTFFLRHAKPTAGGANVVNVMIVDFRALDTLGEITVLGAVALAVFALLRRFRPAAEVIGPPEQQRLLDDAHTTDLVKPGTRRAVSHGYLLVPEVIARVMLPVALVVAAHLFLRGHDAPGGGFVAGLVVAIALLLQYLVSGTRWVERHARLRPPREIAIGLLLAVLTGLGAMLFGYPFLTTHIAHVTLPVIGEVHLSTTLLFDAGVFSVVIGATLLVLTSLAHQSIRTHRAPEVR
ncbi:MAG: monovalent cation/H+ antiporter subunit A [Kofleriaceae bacterium]|nr:monovalent cation/H+ antiporter subunit A [Kofleriaceae bacterium]